MFAPKFFWYTIPFSAADEGLKAAVAAGRRSGDHRMACDHVAVDEIGVGAARRRGCLCGEDLEVVAVRARGGRSRASPGLRPARDRRAARCRPGSPAQTPVLRRWLGERTKSDPLLPFLVGPGTERVRQGDRP